MNENRLPVLITRPDKLSQFRSKDGRGDDDGSFSVLIQNAFFRRLLAEAPSRRLGPLYLRALLTLHVQLALAYHVSMHHFFRVLKWATMAFASSSETPSVGFITTFPSLSLAPSLMALMAASSVNSAWTLASL